MPKIEEYEKKGGWYEFPNGHKVQGKELAMKYLTNVDAAELFEVDDTDDDTDAAADEEVMTVVNTPEKKVEEEVDLTKPSEQEFLVRMVRQNVRYGKVGVSGKKYIFTRQHPLVLVRGEDVSDIVAVRGLELASPQQAKEFYS
jgi:hypothetical protein